MTSDSIQRKMDEVAEKIVIEYARLSGRDSEYRSFVRQAALKILPSALQEIALEAYKEGLTKLRTRIVLSKPIMQSQDQLELREMYIREADSLLSSLTKEE